MKNPRWNNFLNNIHFLFDHSLHDLEEERDAYLTDKIIEDCIYEMDEDRELIQRLDILNASESLDLVIRNSKSFVRTGDGEIKLMLGYSEPFQEYDARLADRLRHILADPNEGLYVGLNRRYFTSCMDIRDYEERKYYRRNANRFRHFYLDVCNHERTYVDANFTMYPLSLLRTEGAKKHFQKIQTLFSGKDLVLVSGEGVFEKLQYNVFEQANSMQIIHGPSRHAFREFDTLLGQIEREVSKEQTVVIILGMAGKAMVPELAEKGFMAWDVGHMAKAYDAFRRQIVFTPEFQREFVAPD